MQATTMQKDHDIYSRIHAEFTEMPGLTLTLPQASRLFNLEVERCERVLGTLVRLGALHRLGNVFARPGVGRRFA